MTLHERTYREDAIERWREDMKERLAGIEDRQERGVLILEATREPAFAEADATVGSYRFMRCSRPTTSRRPLRPFPATCSSARATSSALTTRRTAVSNCSRDLVASAPARRARPE